MAYSWKLSEIRTLLRTLISRPDTDQISDDNLDLKINEYYQNVFPLAVDVPELRGWHEQETGVDDSGKYSLSASVLRLDEPMFINGEQIRFYQDEGEFFAKYPRTDSGTAYYITEPSLAIGSSSKSAVLNSAFSYEIADYSYSKAAAETELSGDTVPQNKYGAWRLEIDTDGTIAVVEASENSSGYDTPAKAVEGLSSESSSKACMGFVTAINTSGTFVPGTTDLDASGVTATFCDGKHKDRDRPIAVLMGKDGCFYLGPKPDDIYLFESRKVIRPTELSGDDDTPLNVRWGAAIAYGTAILIKTEEGEGLEAEKVKVYEDYLKTFNRNRLIQTTRNKRAKPRC